MGTHNRLLRLSDRTYLEVIAIDPEGCAPAVPRWFGLDSPSLQARIADRPHLLTWVAASHNLEVAARHLPSTRVAAMQCGDFVWRFTFFDQTDPPWDGLLPPLIQWDGPHPASRLPQSGCVLTRLGAGHPDADGLRAGLSALRLDGVLDHCQSNSAYLRAEIMTPTGPAILD